MAKRKTNKVRIAEIVQEIGLMEFLIDLETYCYERYKETGSALWKEAAGNILKANDSKFCGMS